MERTLTYAILLSSLLLTACGGEPAVEQSSANINANDHDVATIGEDGTVLFHLDGAGQSFGLTCDGSDPFCGLTMEIGIVAPAEGLTDNQQELQKLGITLETYGPQSFNEDSPSFSADVPAADLVGSAQGFGDIDVIHGGTLRFDLHDPLGLLTEGDFSGLDVQLTFPLCDGGTSWCE